MSREPRLLKGTGRLDRSDDFYTEYSVHHTIRADMRAYRTEEWKLKREFLNPGRDELSHLAVDPGELVNLAESRIPEERAAYEDLSQKIPKKTRELEDLSVGE